MRNDGSVFEKRRSGRRRAELTREGRSARRAAWLPEYRASAPACLPQPFQFVWLWIIKPILWCVVMIIDKVFGAL
jgi:hypothetical protein